MTTDEKLAAILAAVQTDPGNRGLARDPHDNLFTETAGQFKAACRSIAEHPSPVVAIFTGFWIPTATPPAFETDGPLGSAFLELALGANHGILSQIYAEQAVHDCYVFGTSGHLGGVTHLVTCERPGPTRDGRFRTMRGFDITDAHRRVHHTYEVLRERDKPVTIGIGDGGNEIGMGSIPLETMAKNITNAEGIRCVVPVDHLIVAGVSNWGAYALAAGIRVLRRSIPPMTDRQRFGLEIFDPDRELRELQWMVSKSEGLVDGVTGRQEATVDGLPWDVYAAPLLRIREILELP